MSVKPVVLDLYSQFYLPLGLHLKPCLKGFILAILPCLEEENEYTAKAIQILLDLASSVGHGPFYHHLWMSMVSSIHARLPALIFLLTQFSQTKSREDVGFMIGNDPDIMVKALSLCLNDSSVLVQRYALELISTYLPLEHQFLKQQDAEILMSAALKCILRKDMSLNRRFYAWLLTPSVQISSLTLDVLKQSILVFIFLFFTLIF
jgi:hypothetical protein